MASPLHRLERFPPAEAESLAQWFNDNPVGSNLSLLLLELLEDLAKKEGRPATDFFAYLPEGAELQPKERGRRWREILESRLHPHHKAHAEAFAAHVRQLDLPEGVKLEPPQGFEGSHFTLRVSFADIEELRRRLRELGKSVEGKNWTGLWEF